MLHNILGAVVPTNWNSDNPLTHTGDIDIDSLIDSVSGLLKTNLDNLAAYKSKIKKQDKSAPWFNSSTCKLKQSS